MTERLARSAGTISAAVFSSRILGVVREQFMAGLFGTTMANDAYQIAMRVPNLVRDLFAEGAMSAAFVPTFTRYLKNEGREAAWRLGNLVLNALVLVTSILALLGIVYAEPLLRLLPDFADPESADQLALTVDLARLVIPFLTLVAIAVAMGGMLNSLRRFFIPALSPAAFNVGVIISAVTCVPLAERLGFHPIVGIAWGTLLGGLLQVVIQAPLLRREGFRYQPILSFTDPGVRQILLLMGPGTLGLAAAQINVVVNTVLAVGEGEGAVSALGYAFRLMYLPIGIFGVSVATAALPDIARQANAGDTTQMRRTISSSLRMMLMLNVPSAVGLMVLATPIVAFIYERGAFTAESTAMTASALMFYAPGLLGYSAVKIASPSFYAMGDARTPVAVSLLSIVINLIASLTLVRVMGFPGLALGTAIAAICNATLLFILLSRRIGGLDGRRIAVASLKILVAAGLMGTASWWTAAHVPNLLPGGGPDSAWLGATVRAGVQVASAIAAGVAVLALAAWALRLDEFLQAWRRVASRLGRGGASGSIPK
jgi:putative peptidoglycan lipid II flippase